MISATASAFSTTLLLLSLLTCGCSSGYKDGRVKIGDAGRLTEVTTGDSWLRKKIEIRSVRSRREADQRMHGEFESYNNWYQPLGFRWALTWADAQGMLISYSDDYQQSYVEAKSSQTIVLDAPSADAVAWKIDLQRARR